MSRKEVLFQYYYEHIRHNIVNFLKWLVLAVLTGLIVGGASGIFAKCIGAATCLSVTLHIRVFLLLPFAGLLIVFLYQKLGSQDGGTNQVLATIKSKDKIPFISAPLIFLSTLLTHLPAVLPDARVLQSNSAEVLEAGLVRWQSWMNLTST